MARGQRIARPDGFMSVAMHAPASGVGAQDRPGAGHQRPHGAGGLPRAVPGLDAGGRRGQAAARSTPPADEILAAIQEAGVVGLGGAAFPTHVKLKVPEGKAVDTLILNGAECEPYLTTDHRVMLEQRDDIFAGIRYLLTVTGAGAGDRRRRVEQAGRRGAPARRPCPADLPVERRGAAASSTRRAPRRC